MSEQSNKMYTVWNQNAKGNGNIQSKNLNVRIAIPTSKGGSGEGAEPKQLLIAAAVACFTTTLAYLLDRSGIPVVELNVETDSSTPNGVNNLSIIHLPQIVLQPDASQEDIDKTDTLILQAEEQCHIGQLLIKAGLSVSVKGRVTIKDA
ncbi:OsmC family protein [Paenibacillus sp. FSL K6-2862]|uniref:OsmC family protein n=1 Tax=Paenibacillus sp. FSL K6-2862 TaxID=2921484 RepID=UPI0030F71A07